MLGHFFFGFLFSEGWMDGVPFLTFAPRASFPRLETRRKTFNLLYPQFLLWNTPGQDSLL